jgi:heme-degrading monooxygenase HmoA
MLAKTPQPPYYAVIFSSYQTDDISGYLEMSDKMMELAKQQEGFLGIESAREKLGITVSYWSSLEAISKWRTYSEHIIAQQKGKSQWYESFKTRICKVERDYGFEK